MTIYYSCGDTGHYYTQKARWGKFYTPQGKRGWVEYGEYGKESIYLEAAVFQWLSWYRDKKMLALTAEQLADLTGGLKVAVLKAIKNFKSGILSWQKFYVPAPIVHPPSSFSQIEFEKDWHQMIRERKIWLKDQVIADALRWVIKARDRPWNLTLKKNAIVAVMQAEKAGIFKMKKERGEMIHIDNKPHVVEGMEEI